MVGLGAPGLCAKYRAPFGGQKWRLPGAFNGALKSYYKATEKLLKKGPHGSLWAWAGLTAKRSRRAQIAYTLK